MENASKALIIAGAILISILLIGVGMLVFQGAQGGIDEAVMQMSATEKQMFNNNFVPYEGERVRGSSVRALIGNIITSNSANQEIEGKLVTLDVDGTTINASKDNVNSDLMSEQRAKINTGATYNVKLTQNTKTGLVEKVTIKHNSNN